MSVLGRCADPDRSTAHAKSLLGFRVTVERDILDPSDPNVKKAVGREFGAGQGDFQVVGGEGDAGPIDGLIQGERGDALADLSVEKCPAFFRNERADFPTAFPGHASVHLVGRSRRGCSGSS